MIDTPTSPVADAAIAQRHDLIRRCAQSVMDELAAGRRVDPHRVAWARQVLATTRAAT
jgi:hypothetical protein